MRAKQVIFPLYKEDLRGRVQTLAVQPDGSSSPATGDDFSDVRSDFRMLSLDIQGAKALDLMPGVHVVMGKTGAGKTSFLRWLEQDVVADVGTPFVRINLNEPFDELDEAGSNLVAYDLEGALAMAGSALLKGRVPMIDSGRVLVYMGGGATGQRGVNMGIFRYMTQLNNLMARQGFVLLISLNPLVEDEQYTFFRSSIQASVVGLFEVNGAEQGKVKSFTHAQRPDRRPKQFRADSIVSVASTVITTLRGRLWLEPVSVATAMLPSDN